MTLAMKQQNILVLYSQYETPNASTITEHVNSFQKYLTGNVTLVNVFKRNDDVIPEGSFDVIIFHYSLFGAWPFKINPRTVLRCKLQKDALKVAFFQDEYQFCQERFKFIDYVGIDVIYSLLDPEHFEGVYKRHTNVKHVLHTLTGYVEPDMLATAAKYSNVAKDIDVSYRARELPFFLGEGAREKTEIALKFLAALPAQTLTMNISVAEEDRLYGEEWSIFLARSKAALGVEAGVSIFDLYDEVKPLVRTAFKENPEADFHEIQQKALLPFENNLHYRTISPRIFECAANNVCLVLYEGQYQSIIKPHVHYIPLKKDFSNITEVVNTLQNNAELTRITQNAYSELIDSGKYSYDKFIAAFENDIERIINA